MRNFIKTIYLPLILVGFCGLFLSIFVFNRLTDLQFKNFNQSFILDAQNRVGAIKRNIENVTDAVNLLTCFYNSSQTVERVEFEFFARNLIMAKQGMQSLLWVPRVLASERIEYEKKAQEEGFSGFSIYQKGAKVQGTLDNINHEYLPVYYIEPAQGNEGVLGNDLSTEPQRAATLYLARDSNLMIISPGIPLLEEKERDQYAFMVAKPVYQKGFFDTGVESRRENLSGFVAGMVRLSKITDEALGFVKGKEMEILIYDLFAAEGQQLIYAHGGEVAAKANRLLLEGRLHESNQVYHTEAINVLNRQWMVMCLPSSAYLASGRSWLPIAGAGMLFLLTIGLLWYLWVTIRRSADIAREVKRATADLQKVNQELESFAFTASHDMRAPLRGVASFATFLHNEYKDRLDAKGQSYLKEIMQSTARLRELIEGLLSLAKVSQMKDNYQQVNVGEILEYVRQSLAADIEQYGVDLSVGADWPTVCCVRVKMQIVLMNLVMNAIKFSSKNNLQGAKVELGWNQNNQEYIFFVKDNGIGIDPQDHERIFGYFNRLNKSSDYEGNGIGLSIVQKAIEDHGGRVWVESQLGQGAIFYFTLPKRRS